MIDGADAADAVQVPVRKHLHLLAAERWNQRHNVVSLILSPRSEHRLTADRGRFMGAGHRTTAADYRAVLRKGGILISLSAIGSRSGRPMGPAVN
ncbi:hypothetical protein [Palleronia rufa]|uniref:hypothetical protein n=1 Tax=Palleronia rufa TaxID=1530186 RepID=UPI00055F7B73|nr:hypothetical protein [Palleronia rufa]